MHDGDKVGASAIGDLTRSRNKIVLNPFPEGVALKNKFHKVGTHFSYANRRSALKDAGSSLGVHLMPDISIKLDRIASAHGLIHSEIRLNRALKMYQVIHPDAYSISELEWRQVSEVEEDDP